MQSTRAATLTPTHTPPRPAAQPPHGPPRPAATPPSAPPPRPPPLRTHFFLRGGSALLPPAAWYSVPHAPHPTQLKRRREPTKLQPLMERTHHDPPTKRRPTARTNTPLHDLRAALALPPSRLPWMLTCRSDAARRCRRRHLPETRSPAAQGRSPTAHRASLSSEHTHTCGV